MGYLEKEQVYLITPSKYHGMNIVKIGMHKGNTNERIRSYGNKTLIHSIRSVCNSRMIEKELIKQFKLNFKLCDGREFFEAEIDECIDLFDEIVNINKNNIKKDNVLNKDKLKVIQTITEKFDIKKKANDETYDKINFYKNYHNIHKELELLNNINEFIFEENYNYNKIFLQDNKNKKKDIDIYNLNNAILYFEESLKLNNSTNNIYTLENYDNILLYNNMYYIIKDENIEKMYNHMYDLYNIRTLSKKNKFRLKSKRCNSFINTIIDRKIDIKGIKITPY